MRRAALLCLPLLTLAALAVHALRPAQDLPEPTEQHKRLAEMVGVWQGTLEVFMPGVPPEPMPAREVVEAVGPFWQHVQFECDMGPVSYHGSGHFGYDPERDVYLGTWIDSMSPHLSVMEGRYDADKNETHMHWTAPGPDGEPQPHRSVSTYEPDRYTSTFYVGPGEGTRTRVIRMRRAE